MKTDRTSTGRPAIALAAAVLAAALAAAGPARAQNAQAGPTQAECLDAWDESNASQSCPFSSNQFWMTASNEECSVTTRCRKSNGWEASQMQTVTGDLDDMRDLINCDGTLKIGSCLSAAEQAALATACEEAWDDSDASQQCGSSYGSHSVSISNQQCHVSTSCGTLAVAASFYGSPDDVKQLEYCNNQLSTSCPIPVTVENCKSAWNASDASDTCSVTGSGPVAVDSGQCTMRVGCRRWSTTIPGNPEISPWYSDYKGSVEQVKALKNCNGYLKTSC